MEVGNSVELPKAASAHHQSDDDEDCCKLASISKVEIKPSNSVSVEFPSSAQSSEKDDPKVSLAHICKRHRFLSKPVAVALCSVHV